MKELRYTLLSDGSSDRALLPLLTWLLHRSIVRPAVQASWADLRRLRKPPIGLSERILKCTELYPCDLLFVHRDAEGETSSKRISEIERALKNASSSQRIPPAVCGAGSDAGSVAAIR